jgi:sulfur-carrier protein
MQIILFGRLAEITGGPVSVNDAADTDSLIRDLHKTYPALADSKYMIAVNKEIVNVNTILDENSVVALLPPFSGG